MRDIARLEAIASAGGVIRWRMIGVYHTSRRAAMARRCGLVDCGRTVTLVQSVTSKPEQSVTSPEKNVTLGQSVTSLPEQSVTSWQSVTSLPEQSVTSPGKASLGWAEQQLLSTANPAVSSLIHIREKSAVTEQYTKAKSRHGDYFEQVAHRRMELGPCVERPVHHARTHARAPDPDPDPRLEETSWGTNYDARALEQPPCQSAAHNHQNPKISFFKNPEPDKDTITPTVPWVCDGDLKSKEKLGSILKFAASNGLRLSEDDLRNMLDQSAQARSPGAAFRSMVQRKLHARNELPTPKPLDLARIKRAAQSAAERDLAQATKSTQISAEAKRCTG
jgi:hypothetical protein